MEHEFVAASAACPFVRRPLRIEAHPGEFVVIDAGGTVIAKVEFGSSSGDHGEVKLSAAEARSVASELSRMLSRADDSHPPPRAEALSSRVFHVDRSRRSADRNEWLDRNRRAGVPANRWHGSTREEEPHSLWKWVTLVAASIAMLRFVVEVSE